MGICVSTTRSTASETEEVGASRQSDGGLPAGRERTRFSLPRDTALAPLPRRAARAPTAPRREFPHEAAQPLAAHLDAAALARFAMTSRATLPLLQDAQRRLQTIANAATDEIHAFAASWAVGLDGRSPALRAIGELPAAQRADILAHAITEYRLQDSDEQSLQASRERFSRICHQMTGMSGHPRFAELASLLVHEALPHTYHVIEQWRATNTDEPIRWALRAIAGLPRTQRRPLIHFMQTNIVQMVVPADRPDALRVLDEAARRYPALGC